jgi:RHH-type proline utilization regulon transcriptional repressor/proline dehydrogenase/delta 1-pyrroline-5-carboxylate dehydrogenase
MFESLSNASTEIGSGLNARYLADESDVVAELLKLARFPAGKSRRIEASAAEFVEIMRRDRAEKSGLDAFLHAYDLSSAEGVVLMCLAESLLRIPDAATADLLIADRLGAGDWARHLGASESLFVNASTWGLMLTGRLVQSQKLAFENPVAFMRALVTRLGEPVVRSALTQAMRIMARQFVMGRDIREALKRAGEPEHARYRFSFDMLGEAAVTAADADRYFAAYRDAIEAIGEAGQKSDGLLGRPGISVKLSALSPRFEFGQSDRVFREVVPRLNELAGVAKSLDVDVTIDAEEADRLELMLAVFAAVYGSAVTGAWEGLGLAVQAYQRRALDVIGVLDALSAKFGRRIPVRLVKGAYWDAEIKRAQELGLASYPVFTRKVNTDVAYLACTRQLIESRGRLLPQFATHNAHTVAYVLEAAPKDLEYEFQRLHGMGEALYDHIVGDEGRGVACRVYAPVGRHEDLLPYLVRRLLENGANTSFINRIVHENVPVADIVRDPVSRARSLDVAANPRIPSPPELFGEQRRNSSGINLADGSDLADLGAEMAAALEAPRASAPIVGGKVLAGKSRPVSSPTDSRNKLGEVTDATPAHLEDAMEIAVRAFPGWDRVPVADRAEILRRAAGLFEARRAELMALCVAEAGKCIPDALAEIREAVDYLRYYACEAERLMGEPVQLPGPTGERNELSLGGRGVFACISPWNFPVAIFTGQVAAALVTGNTVLAKPAEQASLIGSLVIELLHEAGVPGEALQFLPGDGAVGAQLVADGRLAGVAFTGSTGTARLINRALAAGDGPLATLIAETGGQNAMLVDSTALAEQVVRDATQSAFNSAGQRCSALRVLCLQEDIADHVLEMLAGRVAEMNVGDPARLDTDVGPVIDAAALEALREHRSNIIRKGRLICEARLSDGLDHGNFFAPMVVEIPDISTLREEHFGPILHVVRFGRDDIVQVVDDINATGFGLTFGIQSRIDQRSRHLAMRITAGNVYINRNMIGAVVGAQPFGGRGLSGTGPKAGGPNYLPEFITERTVSTNTAAIGGNATLLTLANE